jgi:hypothetical protein
MVEASKTYVVECYVPGVDDLALQRAADATAGQVRRLGPAAGNVEYLGALLMALDEVVLHAFRAVDPELVRQVSTAAGLRFDRILESVEVLPAALIRPRGRLVFGRGRSARPALLQPKDVPS